jgi:hypothetical protein
MTLPASGPISFNNINVELGVSGTTQASLGQSSYRTLAGVASGQISMSNFYGKANQFAFTISSNQTNANLRTLAVNAGWNQSSKVVATINGGIYISSNGTGTPALTVNGSFPGGVSLVNNGLIIGMGGAGGNGRSSNGSGTNGSAGGLALAVSVAVSITNSGTIGGGGGGGGGGAFRIASAGKDSDGYAGGGGGGGRSSAAANSVPGSGGTASGFRFNYNGYSGTAGTVSANGSGGGYNGGGGLGGAGGGWGAAGSSGGNGSIGYIAVAATSGGAAGGAVTGNANITWVSTGTRLGAIT